MNPHPETAEELKEQIRVLRGGIERLGKVIDQITQYCQKLETTKEPHLVDVFQRKTGRDISKIIAQLHDKPQR